MTTVTRHKRTLSGAWKVAALSRAPRAVLKSVARSAVQSAVGTIAKQFQGTEAKGASATPVVSNTQATQAAVKTMRGKKLSKKKRNKLRRLKKFENKVAKAMLPDKGLKIANFVTHMQLHGLNPAVGNLVHIGGVGFMCNYLNSSGVGPDTGGWRDLRKIAESDGFTLSSGKFRILAMDAQLELTNMHPPESEGGTYQVDIYTCTNRDKQNWRNEVNNTGRNPVRVLIDGWVPLDHQAGGTGPSEGSYGPDQEYGWYSLPEITPFQNPDWCRNFKVIQKKTMMINSGDRYIWDVQKKMNFVYDRSELDQFDLIGPSWFYLFFLKQVVPSAKDSNNLLALDDLNGIKVRRSVRYHYIRESVGANSESADAIAQLAN